MKKRIFAVALTLLLVIGTVAGLHKFSTNSSIDPTKSVADVFTPNGGEPPDW